MLNRSCWYKMLIEQTQVTVQTATGDLAIEIVKPSALTSYSSLAPTSETLTRLQLGDGNDCFVEGRYLSEPPS